MSKRTPAFSSPVPGGEVRRQAPALYWLTYEPDLPRSCAVCPFALLTQVDADDPMAGAASCQLGETPYFVEDAREPPCGMLNWQWRSRQEIGTLWERLTATDEELAEIEASLGGKATILRGTQGVPPDTLPRRRRKNREVE